MIALNEIIDNKELFEKKYKSMGKSIDLTPFVILENKRKIVQIEAENLRADTNKLCASVAESKNAKELVKQINRNNLKIKRKMKRLDVLGKQIDNKLKTLPNIAYFDNELNLQLETAKSTSKTSDFISYLNDKYDIKTYKYSIKCFVKSLRNRLFQESELPVAVQTKSGLVILADAENAKKIETDLLEYLKSNAKYLVLPAIKNLNHSSLAEYVATLNDTESLKLEIKGEYFTRGYKIKYKNTKLDTTKFLYQIDIIL